MIREPKQLISVYLLPPWAPLYVERLHNILLDTIKSNNGSRPCLLCKAACGPGERYVGVYVVLTDHREVNELSFVCASCEVVYHDLELRVFESLRSHRIPDAEMVYIHDEGHA